MIPIGFYHPDKAHNAMGVSGAVLNAILQADPETGIMYGPQPGIGVLSTAVALPGTPRGIYSFVDSTGSHRVIAGTVDKLYLLSATGTWTEIGSGYAVTSGHNWSAAQFGQYAVFTNTFDGQVHYDLDTVGTFSAISGAPKARFIFNLFDTMAALDCDGENRVMRTSKAGDHTVYTGPGTNFQTFNDGQELLCGGELSTKVALVFQRSAVRILTRRPDRYTFDTDLLGEGVGAMNPQAVVFTNGAAFALDTFGFHKVTGGGSAQIGEGKFSRTFLSSLSSNGQNTVSGTYDPQYGRVLWRYQKSDVVSETVFEDVLAYHITFDEAVPLEVETTALVSLASPAYTLEDLDAVAALDSLPYSLDSAYWKGGVPRLSALNGDLKFGFMAGDNLACTLETGVVSNQASMLINATEPYTDSEDATVQCGVKDRLSGSLTWGTAEGLFDNGVAHLREQGKHFAFRLNVAAGETWTFMRGFANTEAVPDGDR